MTTALRIRNLTVSFVTGDGVSVPAVLGIDLDVSPGRVLALVGESGSGKSASLLGTLGLLPRNALASGSAELHGRTSWPYPGASCGGCAAATWASSSRTPPAA